MLMDVNGEIMSLNGFYIYMVCFLVIIMVSGLIIDYNDVIFTIHQHEWDDNGVNNGSCLRLMVHTADV